MRRELRDTRGKMESLAAGRLFAESGLASLMPLLSEENNFADLRETANKLLAETKHEDVKRLAAVVGILLYRCDLLERQVERLARGTK